MKFLVPCLLAASAGVTVAQVGTVREKTQILDGSAGFAGPVPDGAQFGHELANLGDLDGNGVPDLAVASPGDSDGASQAGAVWILFLAADATVVGQQKISATSGGFGGTLNALDRFGTQLASVGDLDGDGRAELAVLSSAPNRLWILFLNADGTVRAHHETLFGAPPFSALDTQFGGALAALGDRDGDGRGDLALGAPRTPDGATGAGAVWIAYLAADGSVHTAKKISATSGGFGVSLPEEAFFGTEIVALGDLDGNGHGDLGVVAIGVEFLGVEYILALDGAEDVLSHAAYGNGEYGLRWYRQDGSLTTSGVSRFQTWLGDLDGDGNGELASGFYASFPGDSQAGFQIGSVLADGSQTWRSKIGQNRGGLGSLPRGTWLGASFAPLGDIDGDGEPELAVGAPQQRAAGIRPGAVWVLSLDTDDARNGSGVNPVALSQVQKPTLGQTWDLTVDATGHASGPVIVWGYGSKVVGTSSPLGEVLIGGTRYFRLAGIHAGGPVTLSTALPPVAWSLLDLPVHVQALVGGAPGATLTNALDVVLGD